MVLVSGRRVIGALVCARSAVWGEKKLAGDSYLLEADPSSAIVQLPASIT